MYLQINASTIDDFVSFSSFLKRRLLADFKQEAKPIITKTSNASSMKELTALLSTVYEGITYQKVRFPMTDLENVLMWVDTELRLPEMCETLASYYPHKKKKDLKTRISPKTKM